MAARRQSKAPLGSLSRNENTKDLQGSNKDSKDLIFVSFQIFIDQDTDYCQSLSTWESEGLLSQMKIKKLGRARCYHWYGGRCQRLDL